MRCAPGSRTSFLLPLLVSVLGNGGAVLAQVPLLVDGTLMSPLGGSSDVTTRAPMTDCLPPAAPRELSPAEKEAEAFRQKQVHGLELKKAVDQVRKSLDWYDDLDAAAKAAAEQKKPIVWIHALGELSGFS